MILGLSAIAAAPPLIGSSHHTLGAGCSTRTPTRSVRLLNACVVFPGRRSLFPFPSRQKNATRVVTGTMGFATRVWTRKKHNSLGTRPSVP